MEFQTHLFVCLFDFLEFGTGINAQNSKRVKAVDFTIGLDGEVEPKEEDGETHSDSKVDHETGGGDGFEALAVLF